jgi:hypothetical protein
MRTAVSLEPPVAMITDFWKRFGTVTFKVTSVTTARRTHDTLVNGSGIILGWIEGSLSMRSYSHRHGYADKRTGEIRSGYGSACIHWISGIADVWSSLATGHTI